jgi:hypothetical protein
MAFNALGDRNDNDVDDEMDKRLIEVAARLGAREERSVG